MRAFSTRNSPLKQEVPCSIAARHRLYWLQCDLFCSRAIWAFALCAAELEAVGQVSRDVQAVQIRAGQRAAGESGGKAVSKLKLRAEIARSNSEAKAGALVARKEASVLSW